MKIKRQQIFDMWDTNHCPKCNKTSEFTAIPTGMPGIACKKCEGCGGYFQADFLEDGDDILECPDDFVFTNTSTDV